MMIKGLVVLIALGISTVASSQMMPSSPQEDVQMVIAQMQKITDDVVNYAKDKKGRAACYSAASLVGPSLHLNRISGYLVDPASAEGPKVEEKMRVMALRIGLFATYCQQATPAQLQVDAETILGIKRLNKRQAVINNAEALKVVLAETLATLLPPSPSPEATSTPQN